MAVIGCSMIKLNVLFDTHCWKLIPHDALFGTEGVKLNFFYSENLWMQKQLVPGSESTFTYSLNILETVTCSTSCSLYSLFLQSVHCSLIVCCIITQECFPDLSPCHRFCSLERELKEKLCYSITQRCSPERLHCHRLCLLDTKKKERLCSAAGLGMDLCAPDTFPCELRPRHQYCI